jgi:hypothetical protein
MKYQAKFDDAMGRWRKGEVGSQVEGATDKYDLWLDFGTVALPLGTTFAGRQITTQRRVYAFYRSEVEPVDFLAQVAHAEVVEWLEVKLRQSPPPGISPAFVGDFFRRNREELMRVIRVATSGANFTRLVNLLDAAFLGARLLGVWPKDNFGGWSATIEVTANDDNDLRRFMKAGRLAVQDLRTGLVVQVDLQKENPNFTVVVDVEDQEDVDRVSAAFQTALGSES